MRSLTFFTIEHSNSGPHLLAFCSELDAKHHWLEQYPDRPNLTLDSIWSELDWINTVDSVKCLVDRSVARDSECARRRNNSSSALKINTQIRSFLKTEYPTSDALHEILNHTMDEMVNQAKETFSCPDALIEQHAPDQLSAALVQLVAETWNEEESSGKPCDPPECLADLMTILETDGYWIGCPGEPDLDWTSLPSFGGPEPNDTSGVWSWDQTHLIIGSPPDLECVSRKEHWTGEEDSP